MESDKEINNEQNQIQIYDNHQQQRTRSISEEERIQQKEMEKQFEKISFIGDKQDSILSTRKPKDAFAGLSSGLKNLGKGILGGVGTIIAAPIIGARQEGISGFAKGLVGGVIGGVGLAVAGASVGVYQIGRGVMNTPESFSESQLGKEWDEKTQKWKVYYLKQEAQEFLEMTDEEFIQKNNLKFQDTQDIFGNQKQSVKSTELYDILEVSPNATDNQIRKSYYLLAKKYHPDKNKGNQQAVEKFQKIGEAYQILSNPTTRLRYDSDGEQGLQNTPKLDSTQIFAIFFGNEKFEQFVGELKMAVLMQYGQSCPFELLEFKQQKREILIAYHLCLIIDPFLEIEGDVEFKKHVWQLIKELCNSPIGAVMLNLIGTIYVERGSKTLGFFENISQSIKQTGSEMSIKYKVMSSAYKSIKKMNQMQEMQQNINNNSFKNGSLPEMTAGFDVFIETAWNVTQMDIEGTLRNACDRLFRDQSVSKEYKQKRGQMLLIMGMMFIDHGDSNSEGSKAIAKQLEHLMPKQQTNFTPEQFENQKQE